MNTLFLLSYLNILLILLNFLSILRVRRLSSLTSPALLGVFSAFFWSLPYTFLFTTSEEHILWLLICLGAVGWITVPSATLYFTLEFTGHSVSKKQLLFIYIPTLVLLAYSLFNQVLPVATGTVRVRLGWSYVNHWNNETFWLYLIINAIYLTIGSRKLLQSIISATTSGSRLRIALITIALGIVSISGLGLEVILPQFRPTMPPISHITIIGYSSIFIYMNHRFDIFGTMDRFSIERVFEEADDMIALIDTKGQIIQCNSKFSQNVGIQCSMTQRHDLLDYLDADMSLELLMGEARQRKMNQVYETYLKIKGNALMPVMYTVTELQDEHLGLLGYVFIFKDISWRKKTEKEIRSSKNKYETLTKELSHIADHDQLTDLPNRRCLFRHLNTLAKEYDDKGTDFWLIYMDLNGFKQINDRYGHAIGDEVLKHVSKKLLKRVKEGGMLARISGDEFIMTVVGEYESSVMRGYIEEIKSTVASSVSLGDIKTYYSMSVGYCAYSSYGGIDLLVKAADEDMYRNKQAFYRRQA